MSALWEFAPAKVNLHLHVLGRRDDGYHLLDSLVVFAGVGDRVSVTPADTLSLSLAGAFAGELEAEADNLVLRAARALAAHAGRPPHAALRLEKNLPLASGIGGGSADAAATLRLLCRFWDLRPDQADLHAIAVGLGADVPACLAGVATLMGGTGEILTLAPHVPDAGIVLLNPGIAVATPSVFRGRSGPFSSAAEFPPDGWQDVAAFAADLRVARNDLEPPARALAPAIDDALRALKAIPDCLLSRMSGSGATCFGLFATPEAARRAAAQVARSGWWAWGGGLHSV